MSPNCAPRESHLAERQLARVTVLSVNYHTSSLLERNLAALRALSPGLPVAVVVDNGSTPESLNGVERLPGVVIDRPGANLGFARAINRAAAAVGTEYLLVLNPDCRIEPEPLMRLIEELDRHPGAGLVSGRVFGPDGGEQRGSRRHLPTPQRVLRELLPWIRDGGVDNGACPATAEPTEVEAVSGACMLIRTQAFCELGGLDAGYFMHFEDLDFMVRLQRQGWTIRLVPEVAISHIGGVSSRLHPVRVLWHKHAGLWRYFSTHCRDQWPLWQRPLWAAALLAHALVRTPMAWRQRG